MSAILSWPQCVNIQTNLQTGVANSVYAQGYHFVVDFLCRKVREINTVIITFNWAHKHHHSTVFLIGHNDLPSEWSTNTIFSFEICRPPVSVLILGVPPAKERHCYFVTTSLSLPSSDEINPQTSVAFLAATKQLYEWYFLSVCPSVHLSVCHTFLTMFPSSYHHEIFRSYHHRPG